MRTYRIAVIAGDGIGCEVIPVGSRLLEEAGKQFGFGFHWTQFPWGSDYYFETGSMMPPDGLDQLRSFDAIYFGAVGHPRLQDNLTLNGLLLPIRRGFDQYACVRPSILYPAVRSPLAGKSAWEIDLVVVRENTEGECSQVKSGGRFIRARAMRSQCKRRFSRAGAQSGSSDLPSSSRAGETKNGS